MSKRLRAIDAEISCNTCFVRIDDPDWEKGKNLWAFTVPIDLNSADTIDSIREIMQKRNANREVTGREPLFRCKSCFNKDPSKMCVIVK